ncbi:sigma factor-like helix-turn-helix DNA-binding protein [Vibrio hepatarius]|uniref:sigma factor-like helix-turn-helix DNA-binding protein n=1 Tax=Vibrio hepatarius TaxID=171383 RepID=UPI00148DF1DD|nr:sigma factor-like helix-turn-helix DNA-binding protein [Vibrio hepatarius]
MLQQQIMILPLEYREPLVLSLMVGLNNAQISDVLGISANTVETRLFNARMQLKKQLDDHALATLTCSSATPSV